MAERSRKADAAGVLQAARAAWVSVPASHRVVRIEGPGGSRVEETWAVRGRGFRKEIRRDGELIGVIVRNPRWEFRHDIPGKTVAAWSADLAPSHRDPDDEGLILDREDFERWARSQRARVAVEGDTIGGRKALKLRLRWPGANGDRGDTAWFDPDSLRPIRQRTGSIDGTVIDTTIDYPPADAVADDLLAFAMPRDALLEVNDPELGRQLYSEGRKVSTPNRGDGR
ncbi:MAG: hypothetical protein U0800_23625 [Isosphaeraceae bacterium]